MTKVISALAALALLSACGEAPPKPSGALRIALAQKCMESLPEGPKATRYNDWGEVVAQCDDNAWNQIHSCIGDEAACWAEIRRGENKEPTP